MAEAQSTNAPFLAPPPNPELRRLAPLVGDWEVHGSALESLAGPAGPVRSRESFEWLDGGYFLVHRYETRFGDQPVQRGVMYWGFDDATRRFLLYLFSNKGPFTNEGNVYEGEIVGNKLICTGPARFTIALCEDGSVKLASDHSFEVEWDLRHADGVWRPWMRDTYRSASLEFGVMVAGTARCSIHRTGNDGHRS